MHHSSSFIIQKNSNEAYGGALARKKNKREKRTMVGETSFCRFYFM
jgi:hypothetical protein